MGAFVLKVGLTGGIASGKSVVGEMFVALGAYLVQADRIAHELMLPGQPVYNQVVRHFGGGILDPDLSVNRAKLADAAFGSGGGSATLKTSQTPSRIDELNRIVHPAVIRSQEEWMEQMGRQDPRAVAIVEAALILEAGAAKRFDRLIVVTCSDEQRVVRFAARHGLGIEVARKEVERRMAAQLREAEKIKAADFVIDNSGALDRTREQVLQVWEQLRTEATSRI
ncbi:MAG TPA: dephospho-CoA kinase [Candidatus Deferrimicrobiaceae bacterium]|nr:dephospho-CoA kinase [Candidatus Deferrimicrobiaceae bacterium]